MNCKPWTRSNAHPITLSQRGVGMVEVLIALIIISIGLLGMAGLQLTGMKQSTNGFNRAKAVLLAEDMATRMRINRTGVAESLYSGFDSTAVVCETLPDPYCQAYSGSPAQRCDAAQLATFDRFSVACGDRGGSGTSGGMADLMPEGSRMSVLCLDSPCTEDSTYELEVQWIERRNASTDADDDISRVRMRLKP